MSRHLVFGDIHGCFNALRALCALVRLRRDDTLVFLGDYVNKGPDSKAVLNEILRLDRLYRLIPLRGNHDILMHRARTSAEAYRQWLQSGGSATLSSYAAAGEPPGLSRIPQAHWHFLEHRLLPFHETATHIFVHAGVHPDLALGQQPEAVLFHEKGAIQRPHNSGKIVVHGHTAQKSGQPFTNGHSICLDTWCYGKGWLSCLDVDAGVLYQANQHRQTRTARLAALRDLREDEGESRRNPEGANRPGATDAELSGQQA